MGSGLASCTVQVWKPEWLLPEPCRAYSDGDHSQPATQIPLSPGCFSFPSLAQSPATPPPPTCPQGTQCGVV